MARGQVHFEVFVRATPRASWRLEGACESRSQAVELAQGLFDAGKVAAARVSKEVLDTDTHAYASYVVLALGAVEEPRTKKKPARADADDPPCVSSEDLYTAHAREKIGRLLDEWLRRRKVTAFELLHRPDLAESLERSNTELLHAAQLVSVAEHQASGAPVHELLRTYQKLSEGAIERLIAAGRRNLFPNLDAEPLEKVAARLAGAADRQFLLGGAVARRLADAPDWRTKVDRLLDLAEATPQEPKARALCRTVIEPLLSEILGSRSGLADLLGRELDRGGALLALTRLVAPAQAEAVMAADRSVAALVPELTGPAARLAALMRERASRQSGPGLAMRKRASEENSELFPVHENREELGAFSALRIALGRKILAELNGGLRLRPADPDAEIAVLRALAMVLTASVGQLLAQDEVQAAFLERSTLLTAGEFVTALTQGRPSALAEVQALLRMAENVMGPLNRKRAAEWIATSVESLRFEREFRAGGADSALSRLSNLAALDRQVRRTGLAEADQRRICAQLGEVAGLIEADARLCLQLGRSPAPLPQKASVLLRLAGGLAAPPGPVAERARAELVRLLKAPKARAELAADPEVASRVRELMAA